MIQTRETEREKVRGKVRRREGDREGGKTGRETGNKGAVAGVPPPPAGQASVKPSCLCVL